MANTLREENYEVLETLVNTFGLSEEIILNNLIQDLPSAQMAEFLQCFIEERGLEEFFPNREKSE